MVGDEIADKLVASELDETTRNTCRSRSDHLEAETLHDDIAEARRVHWRDADRHVNLASNERVSEVDREVKGQVARLFAEEVQHRAVVLQCRLHANACWSIWRNAYVDDDLIANRCTARRAQLKSARLRKGRRSSQTSEYDRGREIPNLGSVGLHGLSLSSGSLTTTPG